MKSATDIKTCGRDPSCDLVLEHETLSRLHAHVELAADGSVSVQDADSNNGTFVNRNDKWVRAKRITLCIGDRLRFGEIEVPLETLTALFGKDAGTRLEAKHFPVRRRRSTAGVTAALHDHGPPLNKPRRNPTTGKIEEVRPVKTQQ